VKTNDALVQVVRAFANEAVPHPEGSVDVARDIATFETEFILSDMAVLETRIERLKKQVQKAGEESAKRELGILERCLESLTAERPLREVELSKEEALVLRTYQLLTSKPMLIALNFDESQQPTAESVVSGIATAKRTRNTGVAGFFGKIDLEMSELPEAEAVAFMKEYGITESALDTLIRSSYGLLGLQSFFTVGEDEVRAWTVARGASALGAAGAIHTDLERGFIRAEVINWKDLLDLGGLPQARTAGKLRVEGRDYVVHDGEVVHIRFNA
jgi:GTP-binding protein YchF